MEVKKKIKEMLNAGHNDIAKLLLREFAGQHPRDADMYLWKAEISLTENQLDDAQRALIEGIGYEHRRFDLYYRLGNLYRKMNLDELARAVYRRAQALNVEDASRQEIDRLIAECGAAIRTNSALKDKPPVVSIIVLAYNHLDYTKSCLESILQYTSHLNYELITVDNGSSDGTGEYLNSLPHTKKVTLQTNAGPVNGFNAGMLVAEGRYTSCISNDFIVTTRWMDNLLACMESDERIGFASPGASSVSNNQQIVCPESGLAEMQRFAAAYNISDPSKWEERVRLLPCVLMVRTDVLTEVGYFDPRFAFGEFADDDISFRIRRAGYKLVFAKDTFVHHYGSVTVGEDQRKHQSLEKSRLIFEEKYSLDAWRDSNFDVHLLNASLERYPNLTDSNKPGGEHPIHILGINGKCGATTLQIRNLLRQAGHGEAVLHQHTDQPGYLLDLQTISSAAVCSPISELTEKWTPGSYDLIVWEGGLEAYPPIETLLVKLHSLLRKQGRIVFKIANSGHFLQLAALWNNELPFGKKEASGTFFRLQPLLELLEQVKLPAIKMWFIQDEAHLHYPGLYQAMEQLQQKEEALRSNRLTVSEIMIIAEAQI